jgi:hypothetical protein
VERRPRVGDEEDHAEAEIDNRGPGSGIRDPGSGWPGAGFCTGLRTLLIRWFQDEANVRRAGLACDIRTTRVDRERWAEFLRGCKAIIGAESGTYYLNDRGKLLMRARDYNLNQNRDASFAQVYDMFFRGQPRLVSGKSISSRHFEPIGTKTCQILLEGEYNGILKPDEHYIPVKRDLSDLDAAIEKFKDASFRQRIADTAYEYAMDGHTYVHRVRGVLRELGL